MDLVLMQALRSAAGGLSQKKVQWMWQHLWAQVAHLIGASTPYLLAATTLTGVLNAPLGAIAAANPAKQGSIETLPEVRQSPKSVSHELHRQPQMAASSGVAAVPEPRKVAQASLQAAPQWEVLGEEVIQDTIGQERLNPKQAMNSYMADPIIGDYGLFATPFTSYSYVDANGKPFVTFLSILQVEIDLLGLRTSDPNILQNARFTVIVLDPGFGTDPGRSSVRHFIPIVIPAIGPNYSITGDDLVTQKSYPMAISIIKNPAYPSLTRHIVSFAFTEAALGNAPRVLPGGAVPLSITPIKGPAPSGFIPHHILVESLDLSDTPAYTFTPGSAGRPFGEWLAHTAGQELAASYTVLHAREKNSTIVEIPIAGASVSGGKLIVVTESSPGEIFLRTSSDLVNWADAPRTFTPVEPNALRWELDASSPSGFVRAFSIR